MAHSLPPSPFPHRRQSPTRQGSTEAYNRSVDSWATSVTDSCPTHRAAASAPASPHYPRATTSCFATGRSCTCPSSSFHYYGSFQRGHVHPLGKGDDRTTRNRNHNHWALVDYYQSSSYSCFPSHTLRSFPLFRLQIHFLRCVLHLLLPLLIVSVAHPPIYPVYYSLILLHFLLLLPRHLPLNSRHFYHASPR